MLPSQKIKIIIQTINNTNIQTQVSKDYTGYQLKEHIYNNITNSLDIHCMKLYYAGVQVQNDKKISSLKIVQGQHLKIIQSKVQLSQIPGLIVAYQVDQISLQQKTARMPCGHVIGRDCMTQFIRSIVDSYQIKITCPSYKPNGQRCQTQWDFALCRKIGVFTAEQNQYFQTGLSKNWIIQNTIQCPHCKLNLFKGDLKMNRVKCPQCKSPDFCIKCSRKWIANNNDICGNKGCQIIKEILQASPWDKEFKLNDEKNIKITYKLPRHRACPHCTSLIEHTVGCKHMDCNQCKKSFCWVCLDKRQNGKWKCKGPFDYCGKIQQVQNMNN